MKIEHLTIALIAIIILIIISAYYSPETAEIKKEEPKFVIIEEEEKPEPVIEEIKELPKEAIVKVKRGFFDPKEIVVKKGTNVIWLNVDDRAHRVADSSTPRYFYGDRFLPGENYSFSFNEVGEYSYFDVIFYQTMKGKVIVVEEEIPITGKVIAIPNYTNKVTGALILVAIITILSIYLVFHYERTY